MAPWQSCCGHHGHHLPLKGGSGWRNNQTADSQYLYRLNRINGEWYIIDCETILEELPGKSRPDYLTRLYEEADNWLKNG